MCTMPDFAMLVAILKMWTLKARHSDIFRHSGQCELYLQNIAKSSSVMCMLQGVGSMPLSA